MEWQWDLKTSNSILAYNGYCVTIARMTSFQGRDGILVNMTTSTDMDSHVMNTTDMDFARDKHDCMIQENIKRVALRMPICLYYRSKFKMYTYCHSRTMMPGNITSSLPHIVTSVKHK